MLLGSQIHEFHLTHPFNHIIIIIQLKSVFLKYVFLELFGFFGDVDVVQSILNNLMVDFILFVKVFSKDGFYFEEPRTEFLVDSHTELQKRETHILHLRGLFRPMHRSNRFEL